MGIGGDWELGPIPNPQSPIPNPQSPIPMKIKFYFCELFNKTIYFIIFNTFIIFSLAYLSFFIIFYIIKIFFI